MEIDVKMVKPVVARKKTPAPKMATGRLGLDWTGDRGTGLSRVGRDGRPGIGAPSHLHGFVNLKRR